MSQLKDHREIGREMDLFSFHDVAPGAMFWHHKGYLIYKTLVEYLRSSLRQAGYQEISTPVMVKSKLFQRSGHWDFYNENMFNLDVEDESYSLKPMNCPGACLVFSTKTRSYQDLPLRFSDFGILHRNELSGVLGGAFRVRQFTIDDAHHFVRPDQIKSEIESILHLVGGFYQKLGFTPEFFLSTKPEKAMGDPKLWEVAEQGLKDALTDAGVTFGVKDKDGAFYGPKIDIQIKDSQGRDWQLATIQLDFQIPERMELEYTDSDGKPHRPVIVHRAVLGSVERFIGILTEHTQGNFPFWLAPVQVAILPVSEKHNDKAQEALQRLAEAHIRVEVNHDDKPLGAKIRETTLQKVPFMVIMGDKELQESELSVSVRSREGKDLGLMKVTDFIKTHLTSL